MTDGRGYPLDGCEVAVCHRDDAKCVLRDEEFNFRDQACCCIATLNSVLRLPAPRRLPSAAARIRQKSFKIKTTVVGFRNRSTCSPSPIGPGQRLLRSILARKVQSARKTS